jgi:cell division control protein 45
MDMDLKSTLRHKLDAIAPEYGLVELTYPSFTRAFGYRCPSLSAADAVEGLAALLEAATGVRIEVEAENGKGGGEWFGGSKTWSIEGVEREGRDDLPTEDKENANRGGNGGLNGRDKQQTAAAAAATVVEDDLDISIKAQQKQHERNFWAAYDAVHE